MLSLDQVRLLENRVEKAVTKIQSLTTENNHLRGQLSSLQSRVAELEGLVRSFKDDQGRIEEGILSALDRLSAFEDSVFHGETSATTAQPDVDASADTQIEAPVQPENLEISSELAPESLSSNVIDIDAEWKTTTDATSVDGQMDIF